MAALSSRSPLNHYKVRRFLDAIAVSSSELASPSEAASAGATSNVNSADVAGGRRSSTSATEGKSVRDQADAGLSAGEEVTRLANELDTARRELENVRERERDARGEADGLAKEGKRSRLVGLYVLVYYLVYIYLPLYRGEGEVDGL